MSLVAQRRRTPLETEFYSFSRKKLIWRESILKFFIGNLNWRSGETAKLPPRKIDRKTGTRDCSVIFSCRSTQKVPINS